MPTRREVLVAGAAALGQPMLSAFAKDFPSRLTPVNFAVPEGACDCHVHIVGDPKRFPMAPTRTYTPETAELGELQAMHHVLHIRRVVVAQISIYGTNNACALDAMKQLGANARGVAMIDDKTPESDLDSMQRAGMRGVRLIFFQPQLELPANFAELRQRFQQTIERVKKRNCLVQLYARPAVIEGLSEQIMASPVPIVLDHFAGVDASLGVSQPGFDGVVKLVQSGKAYIKISAPYRSSAHIPDFAEIAPFARTLIAANPERILWGTDWPHVDSLPKPGHKPTDVSPRFPIDDGSLFSLLPTWAPDAATRKIILVENPARLYGF